MNHYKSLFLASAALLSIAPAMADEKPDSVEGFKFTDVHTVKGTSVKDQNKSGTCWCFSSTSFVEDEIMRNGGDSLDISEMFTVRQCYIDKADRYVRYYGQTNFGPGGAAMDVPYVFEKYGAIPEEAYPGIKYGADKHEHGELHALLEGYLKTIVKKSNRKISPNWKDGFIGILDAYLGEVPETFEYNGKTYTPESFAKAQPVNMDDYVVVTSFTHHPFYESFIMEVPDNWLNELNYNVPMEEMKAIVDNAIKNGYSVAWGADVSEKGFKWKDGVALMPKVKSEKDMDGTELSRWVKLSDADRANDAYNFRGPVEEIVVTQDYRQEMFDNQTTTDDHGMLIEGIATDQNGNRYYKVKNSWDTNQIYDGYLYVSEPYFLAKTMNIMVNKNAIPANIAKKMNITKTSKK